MDKWEYYPELDLKEFLEDKNQDAEYVLLGVLIHSGTTSG